MLRLLFANTAKVINFSNPLRGIKWLSTLEPHYRHGIKFYPNLDLARDVLGFILCSNELGLRGTSQADASHVVLGTSFAMGMSVDEGKNWYDLALDDSLWFNAAMPVGIANSVMLIDDLYKGDRDTLVYLYHPNVWRISESYAAAYKDKMTIFDKQGWKTDRRSMIKLYPKWIIKEGLKWITGSSLYCRWGGKEFHFDTTYNAFNLNEAREVFAAQQMAIFNSLFTTFKKVVVVRVPIKEDSVPLSGRTKGLTKLRAGYDEMWAYFKNNVSQGVDCFDLDHEEFSFEHFHPYDTHWNDLGNKLFAERLKNILIDREIPVATK